MGEIQRKDTASTVADMLAQYKPRIMDAIAAGVDFDRLARVTVSQIRKTPALMKCDPASLAGAIQEAGRLGVEPGLLGQAYLVPYGREATLIIGYRGLVELARRSGHIAKIEARTVHANDVFDVEYGTDAKFRHKPDLFGDRGEMIGVYAEATYRDGGTVQREFMTRAEVDSIKARSKAGRSGPWVDHYEEMAKKTAVRRLIKMLPLSIEDAAAIARADAAEFEGVTVDVTPSTEASPDVDPFAPKALEDNASPPAPTAEDAPPEREPVAVVDKDAPFTDDEIGGGR